MAVKVISGWSLQNADENPKWESNLGLPHYDAPHYYRPLPVGW
jgi:hypothetical protein